MRAQPEREHEWVGQTALPEEERPFKEHRFGRAASNGRLKQYPVQNTGLQVAESSILQTDADCPYKLNSRANKRTDDKKVH
jgi:hypothetical protein